MRYDLETFLHFIGQQVIRGKLGANSAQSYLTSVNRVFESANEAESADVLKVNLEKLFDRFRAHNPSLGENTVASYEGRVRAAVNSFRDLAAKGGSRVDMTLGSFLDPLQVPLRPGIVVRVDGIPSDLSKGEAAKLAAIIQTLALG